MQRIIYLAILLSFTISCQSGLKPLTSPNGKIRVEASNTVGQPTLTITYNDAGSSYTLFDNLLTGLKTDRRNLTDSMKLVSVTSPVEIVEEYTMITGKKSDCSNHGFECTYSYENPKGEKLDLVVRTYDDGVTFRYRFNSCNDGENIIEEATTYPIAEGIRRWNQPLKIDYEGFYTPTQSGISDRDPRSGHINTSWTYPQLLEPSDSVFVMITEANIHRNR